MPLLSRLLKSGVGWGMIGLGIRLASAAALMPLMTRLMAPAELGYWYLFTSFFAMIVVLDFGITPTAARKLSDLLGRMAAPDGQETRREAAVFLGSCRTIYEALVFVTFIGLSLAGGWWIWQNTSSQPRSDIIRMTWMIACPAFALAVISNFGRVLLYATNQVNVLQFLSTCAFSLQAVVSIGGILAGFGIQALVAANLCMFSILALSLFTTRFLPGNLGLVGPWQHGDRSVIHGLLRTSAGTFCNNLATYTVLNANVLIASHFLPIAEIASYGITLQIGMICSQVSTIWLEVKQPLFAQWTRTNPEALQKIFISRMRLALLSYCGTITVAIIIGPHLLSMIGARTPLLPLGPFIALALLLLVVMHHSQFESVCLGVGHNPFIPAYLTSAGAGAFFAISFARDLGIWALILGPLAAQLAWNSWWVPRQGLQKLQLAPFQYLRRLAIPKWNDFNI